MKKEIKFSDLSFPLKAVVGWAFITMLANAFGFFAGFIIGFLSVL